MAATESLKKIMYDNLQQFVEDINRNFAIIQNSPLYKGIPGDEGEPGKTGLHGERGSHFYFVRLENFLQQYPQEIVNGSTINLAWLNTQLKSLVTTKKLLETLNVTDGKFVNNDVVVLTSSEMIEYDAKSNSFISTGISFYQQGSLVTSLEQRIEQYVKYYVDTNPTITGLKNIFVDYQTYATLYAQTNNTYITNAEFDSSVYMPLIGSVSGTAVNSHKYFGYSRNQVETSKSATTVFGSMDVFKDLLNATISLIKQNTYTSAYAPSKNNIPSVVVLQDTLNNGIMFGFKGTKNDQNEIVLNPHGLARFGSIFKDYTDVHIKSDQGDKIEDYSEILLNRNRLRYDKYVEFGDDLLVKNDFQLDANINSRWIRTAEYGKVQNKANYIEVGFDDHLNREVKPSGNHYSTDTIYNNISRTILLPAFAPDADTVDAILTVTSNNYLNSRYFVEKQFEFKSFTNVKTLNDIEWKATDDSKNHLITSNHLLTLIQQINNAQQWINENFWRRDEWEETNRGTSQNRIPYLKINILDVYDDVILGNDENYFTSNKKTKTLNIGFQSDGVINLFGKNRITVDYYNSLPDDIKQITSVNIVTSNSQGTLTKQFGIYNKFDNFGTDVVGFFTKYDESWKNVVPTVYHLGIMSESLQTTINKTNNETWHKKDFTANANSETGEDSRPEVGNIPNLWVKNLLGGKVIDIHNGDYRLLAGYVNSSFSADTLSLIGYSSLLLNSDKINLPNEKYKKDYFLSLDNSNNIETINFKFVPPTATPSGIERPLLKVIQNAENQILTAESFSYLFYRINNTNKFIADNYWLKSEYAPEDDKPVIPSLYLSDKLKVYGNNIILGPKVNPAFNFNGKSLYIGQKQGLLTFIPWRIVFNEYNKNVLVTDEYGYLRDDIVLCEITGDTKDNDNTVPESSTDTDKFNAKANTNQTQDEHQIITGKQWKWLQNFIDNVKKRFINTFNKKETIDFVYDHMPVGSIVMWTFSSYEAALKSYPDTYFENCIPKGWVICDGRQIPTANGIIQTPDLRNSFVRGVGSTHKAIGFEGSDTVTIERKHLPNLSHNHICDDIISEHTHTINNSNGGNNVIGNNFKGKVWSNRKLTENFNQFIIQSDSSITKNGAEYNLKGEGLVGLNKGSLEIPMIYKHSGPDTNIFGPLNYRHKKDDTDNSWRRYDFDATRTDCTVVSSNLSTIFENFANMSLNSAKVTIRHNIDNFNIGTGIGSDIENQEKLTAIPRYYKVVYIMKYDTRVATKNGTSTIQADSRYNLL